ncbi:MAG: hypothetical protein LBJ03_03315 [Holosporales bacterium]|jgi:hypothetical protein|nr:hypothetical protein [Holosporales bacterium]
MYFNKKLCIAICCACGLSIGRATFPPISALPDGDIIDQTLAAASSSALVPKKQPRHRTDYHDHPIYQMLYQFYGCDLKSAELKAIANLTPISGAKSVYSTSDILDLFQDNWNVVKDCLPPRDDVAVRARYYTGYDLKRADEALGNFDPEQSPACEELLQYFGQPPRHKTLLTIAKTVSKKTGIYIHREAKRRQKTLYKWFNDNWHAIRPVLHQIILTDQPAAAE